MTSQINNNENNDSNNSDDTTNILLHNTTTTTSGMSPRDDDTREQEDEVVVVHQLSSSAQDDNDEEQQQQPQETKAATTTATPVVAMDPETHAPPPLTVASVHDQPSQPQGQPDERLSHSTTAAAAAAPPEDERLPIATSLEPVSLLLTTPPPNDDAADRMEHPNDENKEDEDDENNDTAELPQGDPQILEPPLPMALPPSVADNNEEDDDDDDDQDSMKHIVENEEEEEEDEEDDEEDESDVDTECSDLSGEFQLFTKKHTLSSQASSSVAGSTTTPDTTRSNSPSTSHPSHSFSTSSSTNGATLNFKSLGIQGRSVELQCLKTCFQTLVDTSAPPTKQLILISGQSGTGKTTLATDYLQKLLTKHNKSIRNNNTTATTTNSSSKNNNTNPNATDTHNTIDQHPVQGLLARGKFGVGTAPSSCTNDPSSPSPSTTTTTTTPTAGATTGNTAAAPFSGLASACGQVCGALLQLKTSCHAASQRRYVQICRQLHCELNSELALLVHVLPVLTEILDHVLVPKKTKEQHQLLSVAASASDNNTTTTKQAVPQRSTTTTTTPVSSSRPATAGSQPQGTTTATTPRTKARTSNDRSSRGISSSTRRRTDNNNKSSESTCSTSSAGGPGAQRHIRPPPPSAAATSAPISTTTMTRSSSFSSRPMTTTGSGGGSTTTTPTSENNKDRLYYAIVRFLRILCQHFDPLILVLDDLQVADGPTVGLLEVLLTDQGNRHRFMIVGIYRSNEVSSAHKLHATVTKLRTKSQQRQHDEEGESTTVPKPEGTEETAAGEFAMTELHIGNLDITSIHTIIQKLLRIQHSGGKHQRPGRHERQQPPMSKAQTWALAELCQKKTLGNTFFLLQFLSMLYHRRFLRYHRASQSWTWQEEEIEASTSATDNVIDLLKVKLTTLAQEQVDLAMLQLVHLASCFGVTFELDTMYLVWQNFPDSILSEKQRQRKVLESGLQVLQNHDLIRRHSTSLLEESSATNESETTTSYSWAHDKIQEAASLIAPKTDRVAFGRVVGEILVQHLDAARLTSSSAIFVVVNLLNAGENAANSAGATTSEYEDQSDSRRVELAYLNCQAGERSMSLCAFDRAAEYASKGIQLLPDNAWMDHTELCLALYSIGAMAENYNGNVETMERYCKEVMLQNLPMAQKFDVYTAWVDSMAQRGNLQDAIFSLLEVLGNFDCRLPRKASSVQLSVLGNILQIKATMKKRNTAKLEYMTDRTRIELMRLLDKLATCCYRLPDERFALVVFKAVNWTMKYGFCEFSSPAFASTGVVLAGALGDFEGGFLYGRHALRLMEKSPGQETAARTMFIVYSYLYPWMRPAKDVLTPLLRAYDIALKTGDTESATWITYHWMLLRIMEGTPLADLEADFRNYTKQLCDLRGDHAFYMVFTSHSMRQVFCNLMGWDNRDDPTNMVGEISNVTSHEFCLSKFPAGVQAFQGLLWTYFGHHVQHADLVLQVGHDFLQKTQLSTSKLMWDTFHKGVSCYAAARETGRHKYLKLGHMFRAKVKKWSDMGNPNVKQYLALLDAEAMALKKRGRSEFAVIKEYEVAILLAERGGYQHDAALASERLGEYQLTVMKDSEQALYRFEEAKRYWRSWGALAKVVDLDRKYASLKPKPTREIYALKSSARQPSAVQSK